MEKPLLLLLSLFLLVWNSRAVTSPVQYEAPAFPPDSLLQKKISSLFLQPLPKPAGRLTLLEKAKQKLLQKIWKRQLRSYAGREKTKGVLATIALLAGVLGFVLLLVPQLSILSLLLIPTAIVTGIIALNNNKNKESRTKALIGLIMGLAAVLIILLAVLLVFLIWRNL